MSSDSDRAVERLVDVVRERERLLQAVLARTGELDEARLGRLRTQQQELVAYAENLRREAARELAEVRAARASMRGRSAETHAPLITSQRA